MTTLAPIAAVLADAEDMFNVVFLLIFIVIGIIASIAKKAMEKKQQEQRERERGAQAPRQPQPPARRPQRVRPQPQQYSPIATAQVAEPLETLGAGVAGEVQRRQQQQAATERQRAARMTTRTPPEADFAAIERRLIHVGARRRRQSAGKVTSVSRAAVRVDLHSRAAARRAIVYFEIFSPPKALRKGGEMWDV